MRMTFAIVVIAALSIQQKADAEAYRLDVSGHVGSVSSSLTSRFAVGQTASAFVLFDTAAAGYQFYPSDPSIWYYPDAPTDGALRFGSYVATFTPTSRIFVTDNEGGTIDRFIFEDTDPIGASVASLPLNNFFINFQGGVNTLNSISLTDIPIRLAAFGPATGVLDFGTANDGANRVVVTFDKINLSAIPEPATWAILLSGLAATGSMLRRRRETGMAT